VLRIVTVPAKIEGPTLTVSGNNLRQQGTVAIWPLCSTVRALPRIG
jgi:hypothetical protein